MRLMMSIYNRKIIKFSAFISNMHSFMAVLFNSCTVTSSLLGKIGGLSYVIFVIFATFFTNKTRSISSQFSAPQIQELKPTTSSAKTPVFAFCPLTGVEVSKLLLSSHPTTCPLDPIPLYLQAISPPLLPALTHRAVYSQFDTLGEIPIAPPPKKRFLSDTSFLLHSTCFS